MFEPTNIEPRHPMLAQEISARFPERKPNLVDVIAEELEKAGMTDWESHADKSMEKDFDLLNGKD